MMSAKSVHPSVNHSSLNQDIAVYVSLIDENEQRAASISSALDNSRYRSRHFVSPGVSLLTQVDDIQSDIIAMDIESPSRDILENLQVISHSNSKSVVMFTTHTIDQSIELGGSAYKVGDIEPVQAKSSLDAAVVRFRQFQKIKNEPTDSKQQLASRRVIDQAQDLLMKNKNLSEDNAFRAMRKTATDNGQKLDVVAKTLISLLSTL